MLTFYNPTPLIHGLANILFASSVLPVNRELCMGWFMRAGSKTDRGTLAQAAMPDD